jgi:hypothetical protein
MANDSIYDRIEPSQIHLARPGQRKLGQLNGIRPDSCSLTVNSNNASTLDFEIDKYVDGELSNYYDHVAENYELEVTGFGWFLINQPPQVEFDGENEYKTVSAESLETQLQHFDLTGFRINCGVSDSAEMNAVDNTYEDDYGNKLPRDQVTFWRDTKDYSNLKDDFVSTDQSLESFHSLLYKHPCILSSWRIGPVMDTFVSAVQCVIADYRLMGKPTEVLESYLENPPDDLSKARKVIRIYPEILKYISIEVNLSKEDSGEEYTLLELITLEEERMNQLSLMRLVFRFSAAPWSVGVIDDSIDPKTNERLADMVGKFEVDSQDVYSFLTQDLAQYFQCLFTFDTNTHQVNAIKLANYGEDTNIFLSYHNVQQSLSQTFDARQYTVFRVANNDGLNIRNVNFEEDTIFDYSYFMNTKHFSREFIDKFHVWEAFRESKRQSFIDLTKDLYAATEKADEIYYRVPDSGSDIDKYESYSTEQLNNMLKKYTALKTGYEASYTDSDGNFDMEKLKASSDWTKYKLIVDVILPNIETELSNREAVSEEDQEKFNDEYLYNLDMYGDLYGIQELEILLKNYKNYIDSHIKNGTNVEGDPEDVTHAERYKDYLKYKSAYDQCERVLSIRKQEHQTVTDKISDIKESRLEIIRSVDMMDSSFGFTQAELDIFTNYYIRTDYVNDNILITSLDDSKSQIDKTKTLYDYAVEELSAACRPQYSYTTTQDNILAMPEFKDWHDQLKVGNFIRVATDEHSQAKLRLTSITLNPLTLDNNLEFEFSTMTQYASKRNDIADLLSSAMSAQKNQITALTSSSSKDGFTVDADFIYQLLHNSTFNGYMSNVVGDSVTAIRGSFDYLSANFFQAVEINVGKITGTTGEFEEFFVSYLDVDTIVGDSAIFKNISADIADLESLLAGHAGVGDLQAIRLTADNVVIEEAVIKNLIASNISVADLAAHSASAELITLISSSTGTPTIAFKDSTQQFYDSDGHVRVQIGQDASGEFTFILRAADGATTLIDGKNGVTRNAIADGLIVNEMIESGTIHKDRLSFPVIEANEYGGIDITQIYDGKGNVWGIQYNQFKESVSSGLNDVHSGLGDLNQKIEENIQYKLEIISTNGILFSNSVIHTTLTPILYRGNIDVTDQYGDECFIWHRLSDDQEYDEYWDSQHVPQKQLRITNEDVYKITTFRCDFVLEDTVLASSQI